jgi:DNA-binding LacI/PurR family transcriptional regulator
MGMMGAQLLFDFIEKKQTKPVQKMLDASLVIRKSTATL